MAEPSELSPEEISERVKAIFGLKPCLWQIEAARAQLSGNDVIVIAPTGMGKTLAFQIPLCLDPDRILIIVSPLTTLSQQHAANLLERGISSFALCQGTVSSKALEVCLILTYSCGFDYVVITLCGGQGLSQCLNLDLAIVRQRANGIVGRGNGYGHAHMGHYLYDSFSRICRPQVDAHQGLQSVCTLVRGLHADRNDNYTTLDITSVGSKRRTDKNSLYPVGVSGVTLLMFGIRSSYTVGFSFYVGIAL
jgi:hypothetical protein